MRSSVQKRLVDLEKRLRDDVIVLWMPDGTTRTVTYRRVKRIICGENFGGETISADLQSIVDSVADNSGATGHGELVSVLRSIGVYGDRDKTTGERVTRKRYENCRLTEYGRMLDFDRRAFDESE